ncbi:MAG: 50S ribosomal protein L6 [bacterium]
MSRIGIQPIKIEEGVTVEVADDTVKVKGPLGELEKSLPRKIEVKVTGGEVIVERKGETKQDKSNHGTIRSIISNMINGVKEGYKKELELVGMGYRAEMQGRDLVMYIGWNHPVKVSPPEDITIEVKDQSFVEISGADKQKVGLWAANIRKIRKPEPYKGKGIKYVEEIVRRKTSKSVKEESNA